MKNLILMIAALSLIPALSSPCGAGPVVGMIVPLNGERVTIVKGDKGLLSVGLMEGIIKGDIGAVAPAGSGDGRLALARCAVLESAAQSSVCEVIEDKKEIDPGSSVFFEPVVCADGAPCSAAIGLLARAVDPYPPHKRLKVCIYGLFDSENATTRFSEEIGRTLAVVFGQKKRIDVVERSALGPVVFYPGSDGRMAKFVQDAMKRTGIDVLVTGSYRVAGKSIELDVRAMYPDRETLKVPFSIPLDGRYLPLLSSVVAGPSAPTLVESSACLVALKTVPFEPRKDEKAQLIRREAAENLMAERTLRRADFNLLGPVDIDVRIDGEHLGLADGQEQTVALPNGLHRLAVSFRRGYFFNESLLYTSPGMVSREALLDLTVPHSLVVRLRLDPLLSAADAIGVEVYESAARERQVLKPIYRVQSEKSIDVFKD